MLNKFSYSLKTWLIIHYLSDEFCVYYLYFNDDDETQKLGAIDRFLFLCSIFSVFFLLSWFFFVQLLLIVIFHSIDGNSIVSLFIDWLIDWLIDRWMDKNNFQTNNLIDIEQHWSINGGGDWYWSNKQKKLSISNKQKKTMILCVFACVLRKRKILKFHP